MLRRELLLRLVGFDGVSTDPIAKLIDQASPAHISELESLLRAAAQHDRGTAAGMSDRFRLVSERFLGKPFFLGPCGEGPGTLDPDPFFT
ncbi:hypothetical protein WDZ92_32980, partial [Nostoc sp. NIES-2111]